MLEFAQILCLIQFMYRVGGAEPQVGAVSRAQLLATNIIERVHDAIYVLPRAVDTPDQTLNLKEYALDIAFSVKELARVADDLPELHEGNFQAELRQVAEAEELVDEQIRELLLRARFLKDTLVENK